MVLLRGYGSETPPNWPKIDATLTTMQLKYGLKPAASEWRAGMHGEGWCMLAHAAAASSRAAWLVRSWARVVPARACTRPGAPLSTPAPALHPAKRHAPRHACISPRHAPSPLACAASYNALLEVCSRMNDLERGQDIVDRMVADEVEPDEGTLAAVHLRRSLRAYLRKAFPGLRA